MCGLCGVASLRGGRPRAGLQREIVEMTKALAHRGPDGEGFWVDERVGLALGHRRLAVQDPSEGGRQPMRSPCGRYVVVYNGELYDFAELGAELESRGPRVTGTSDTAVLVAALTLWGIEASLDRFDGMFALAIWDTRERRLHLARDALGKKPLYVARSATQLWFGSELKALRAHSEYDATPDRAAMAHFLRFSFVPAPHCIDRGAEKLRAGEHVSFELDRGGRERRRRFFDWRLRAEEAARDPFAGTGEEAVEALEARLRRAVRRRLVADVPVGALLSGGVDSSLVLAIAQQEAGRALSTFHVGFEDAAYDETAAARAVAARFGARHESRLLRAEQARDRIPALPAIFDEPFADTSALPTVLACSAAREEVSVVLTGDGGDEAFAGYARLHRCVRRGAWLARLPAGLRGVLAAGLDATTPRAERLAEGLRATGPDGLFVAAAARHPEGLRLVRDAHGLPGQATWPRIQAPLARLQALDLIGRLPESILVKVDRASMTHGLEVRSPLLDRGVLELALRLPASILTADGRGKWPLRRLLRRWLPAAAVERPKQGFSLPIGEWLRGPLRPWAEDLLSAATLRQQGWLHVGEVRRLWNEHLRAAPDRRFLVWNLLQLQAWLNARA